MSDSSPRQQRWWLRSIVQSLFIILATCFVALTTPPADSRWLAGANIRGLYGSETDAQGLFRWTDGNLSLPIDRYRGAAAIIATFTASAPQPSPEPIAAHIGISRTITAQLSMAAQWRHYQMLLPVSTAGPGPLTLELSSIARRPAGETRSLGVALRDLTIAPLGINWPWSLARWAWIVTIGAIAAIAIGTRYSPAQTRTALMGIASIGLGLALADPVVAAEVLYPSWRPVIDLAQLALAYAATTLLWRWRARRHAPLLAWLVSACGLATLIWIAPLRLGGGALAIGAAGILAASIAQQFAPSARQPPMQRRSLIVPILIVAVSTPLFLWHLDDVSNYHNDEGY